MPMNSYSVRLKQVVEEFNLIVARESSDYDRIDLMVEEVMRPGLPLAGFFTHFEPLRLQVIGNAEATYLHSLTPERRAETFDQLFSYHIPALVFARNIEPMPECMQMAEKHDITILRCLESTSYVVSSLITYLKNALAPRITRHGVFVEVYGEGLLLMGESGIGKSEAAAELLKRGHRLIADDAVEIRKVAGNTLRGTSPELIRNYIEIRGIGVINVAKLFGMAAIKDESTVDLVVNIVPVGNEQIFDRLGLEEQYMDLLGVKVPAITIPPEKDGLQRRGGVHGADQPPLRRNGRAELLRQHRTIAASAFAGYFSPNVLAELGGAGLNAFDMDLRRTCGGPFFMRRVLGLAADGRLWYTIMK